MKRVRVLCALLLVAAAAPSFAQEPAPESSASSDAIPCAACLRKICRTHCEPANETKTCWDIECKDICVPQVQLPCWLRWFEPLARCEVRTVKVLKEKSYEVDTCAYRWEVETVPAGPCVHCPCP